MERLGRGLREPGATVLDLGSRVVLPGLVDAHIHLLELSLIDLDLRGAGSIEEIRGALARALRGRGRGEWLVGFGWDQERLRERRPPTRWDLDDVSPHNPVLLMRICGHVAVANSAALRAAGITRETPDPPNGRIGREDEEPDGLLYEGAVELVRSRVPLPGTGELAARIRGRLAELAGYGVTEVHSMSVTAPELEALRLLESRGELPVRVRAYLAPELMVREGPAWGEMLSVEGVKVFADGSLGARTAYLREPYSDDPGNRGLELLSAGQLAELIRTANGRGLRLAVHAIGDAALENVLRAIREVGGGAVRVEHASVAPPDLVEGLSELGIPVCVQPAFVRSDWWVPSRLGPRARYAYPFKTMLRAGLRVAAGSDAPVESADPWECMRGAVERGYAREEALTPDEVLRLYFNGRSIAIRPAHPDLVPGAPADLVVLDSFDPNCFKVRVHLTLVNGRVVFGGGGRGEEVR